MRGDLLKVIFAALVVAVGITPQPSLAAFKTGNDLLRECEAGEGPNPSMFQLGACAGYILGVADTIAFWSQVKDGKNCIPASSQAGQLKDIVVKHLKANPEVRHFDAHTLTYVAFRNAFNCPLIGTTNGQR